MFERIADLDADGVCVAAEAAHARLVAAEAERFVLAAHWADLHSGEAVEEQRRRGGGRGAGVAGVERGRRLGAAGTPLVAEFAAMEFGALVGMGQVAAGAFVRDALNVRHRHPLLWAAVAVGGARVWQAREVARLCAAAGLDRDQARWVDAETTRYVGSLPWGRFHTLVEAKIVEVDPAAAEERRVAAAMRRFVSTGQCDEYGLKTLVARAAAGDVVFFVAMVDRIAGILAERGDTDSADVRRSKAIGILATPARALLLLHDSATAHTDADTAQDDATGDDAPGDEADADAGGDPQVVGEHDVHPSQNDADDPAPGRCPGCSAGGPMTGDPTPFVKALVRLDPRRLLPNATLYVHLSQESLTGTGTGTWPGVGRVEGVGPVTVQQAVDLLGHTNVRVVPVLDLAGQVPVDAYETPDAMREAVLLRTPACASPWSANLSRRKDMEHVVPYLPPDRGGPPGQTNMENLAPLARFPHRVKTHGRWRLRQPRPGVYEWSSPHGYRYRVDHTGTHRLGKAPPGYDDIPGIDVYQAPFAIELDL